MNSTTRLTKLLLAALLTLSINSFSQSLTPFTLGTLSPGDSVVIYYDVTINSGAGAQVTSQGQVSGTNFTTFSTDDPDTGPVGDATITPLNMFPLPVTLLELSAAPKGSSGVEVAWQVASETGMVAYEVERSADGRSFQKIGAVAAQHLSRYTLLDPAAASGTNYYRLRLVEGSGAAARYSPVVRVDLRGRGSMVLFPNPAHQKGVTLQLSNVAAGNYRLQLVSTSGQVVYTKALRHEGGSLSRGVSLPLTLSAGTYFVRLTTDGTTYQQVLVIR